MVTVKGRNCRGGESNPHARNGPGILSPVRLPIPPPRRLKMNLTTLYSQYQEKYGADLFFLLDLRLKIL